MGESKMSEEQLFDQLIDSIVEQLMNNKEELRKFVMNSLTEHELLKDLTGLNGDNNDSH
jgi:hypothetical protein